MNLGTAQIIQGNALNLPLPDNSVDACITSPPYFGLRSYQDAGVHYDGQIGSEATPAEFLDALIAATREMVRVLKPSGSIFVNLGDKYSQNTERSRNGSTNTLNWGDNHRHGELVDTTRRINSGIPTKSLMGIPWRYALRCIDELGLILRAEIIWNKPNGLPESVTDRVRRSHEQWFHFTVQPRYFAAVDEIREPHRSEPGREGKGALGGQKTLRPVGPNSGSYNSLGALPGSVWSVPTQPLQVPPELGVDHFAAYPMEWPRRIIQGWTPNGICTQCGEGRRPVGTHSEAPEGLHSVERRTRFSWAQRTRWTDMFASALRTRGINPKILDEVCGTNGMAGHWTTQGDQAAIPTPEQWDKITEALDTFGEELDEYVYATEWVPYIDSQDNGTGVRTEVTGRHRLTNRFGKGSATTITGYVCACLTPTAPTTPSTVVDPFGGTGTTALVAKALGRTGITIDLSNDYCRLAEWRCNDPRELAAALQVEKPEPVHPDQLDLFSETT